VPATPPSTAILENALADFRGDLTVADAATRSGLPLREAEGALRGLAAEYGGHLSATSKGELIYSFPGGLTRPPETRLLRRAGRALVKFAAGALRLVVRAWVSVVLVGYALAFVAILLGLAFRGGDDRDDRSPLDGVGSVLRMVAEALFWTFHPFSPVSFGREPYWLNDQPRRRTAAVPFYERVNRFVFGPPAPKLDPRESERQVLAEIRRNKGRISPADVMRITGCSRPAAEQQLLRLMVDYEGDLTVSESGAILYSFADLRATAGQGGSEATGSAGGGGRASAAAREVAVAPAWRQRAELPPLTGNTAGSNALFAAINGFNLLASGYVLANGLTLERLAALFTQLGAREPMPLPPVDGLPLVLGAIPLAFSVALFALPVLRLLRRPGEARRVERDNGWRGLLRLVLDRTPADFRAEYPREEVARAWAVSAGRAATERELDDAVRRLGGEVELAEDGTLVYRFAIMGAEVEALQGERQRAADSEAFAGDVVFSSADPGAGIRDEPRAPKAVTGTPAPAQLEEHREPVEFLERLMAEAKRRRE
jgi:hypothetical protein